MSGGGGRRAALKTFSSGAPEVSMSKSANFSYAAVAIRLAAGQKPLVEIPRMVVRS